MIGIQIRKLRLRKNLTQEDFAKRLGVSRQAVCMWEMDKRDPNIKMIREMAGIFGVAVNEILGKEVNDMVIKRDLRRTAVVNRKEEEDMALKSRLKNVFFEVSAPGANRVAVTGDFNSWDKNGILMKKEKAGLWRKELNLKPGKYEYKFIVDGSWWTDPLNKSIVTNAFGSQNSVKEVTL